jgi:DNA-binding NarL/FixJ family response regulator
MIKIILADDHNIVRKGLKALLSSEEDFEIIGEAKNGLEAVTLVEKLQPDILVLDLLMPGINGLEVARRLKKLKTKTSIVILSMHDNEAYVSEALRTGVDAYVLKESPPEELIYAIRKVIAGGCYLSPAISEQEVRRFTRNLNNPGGDPYNSLTSREKDVFQLTSQGLTGIEIASRLNISPRTVESHQANIMDKLNLHSQSQLIQYALQRGLAPDLIKKVDRT